MDCKFVTFVVFAIAVGVTSPVFGTSGSTEDPLCPTEFMEHPLFDPFKDVVNGISELLKTTRPNDYLELEDDKCRSYSVAQKMFDLVAVGIGIIRGNDCSRIPEVDGIGKTLMSDADNILAIFYSAVRMIIGNDADLATELDDFEDKSASETTGAFHALFYGVKIVLAEMCPDSQLVQVEDSIGSLNAIEMEVNAKIDDTMDAIAERIEKTCDDYPEYNIGGKVDCSLLDSETGRVHTAMNEFFHNIFEALRNLLPKKPE